MTNIFHKYKSHLIAIGIFILSAVIYFLPQFQGKTMQMGDIVNFKRMSHEAQQHEDKTGEVALWTNALFGGMPTYQITAPMKKNLIRYVEKAGHLWFPRPAGYYIFGMLGFYLLLIVLGVNQYLAIVGALCFAFTTNNMVIFEAGHTSKVKALMSVAPIIAGVILCYRKKYFLGALIFSFAFAINVFANHPQMTYYLGITLFILVGFYLFDAVKNKAIPSFVKSSGLLLVGALLGIGTSASKIWTTYEYGEDTMRGKPILEKSVDPSSSSAVDGLAWDYAMVYSNSMKDLMSMIVPLAVGGGSSEELSKDSAFAKELRKMGANTRNGVPAPTYWGDLSINGGPIYMGAIVIFLLLLSMFTWKSKLKIWGLTAIVVTLLFSLGHNAGFWNHFFFDYFPLFNKFRTPNSVIGITTVLVPFVAFVGLDNYLKSKDRKPWHLYAATGIAAGFCLFLILFGTSMFDFSSAGDARYAQLRYPIDSLMDDRVSMQRSSALHSLVLILLAFGMLFLHNKGKLKPIFLIVGLGALCFGDLFITGKRYLNSEDFIKARAYKQNFEPRPVDTQILADNDPNFRVLDLSINTWNSSEASYFHKTIGGYHAAKLQRIQDIIVRHISNNNQKVLNMLNTKYIIAPGENNQAIAQRNPASQGNAWFVNNIKMVNTANEEIDALDSFDPQGDAIIHKEFSPIIQGFNPAKDGNIALSSYSPNKLTYKSNSGSDQLAVFSEIWYGPNKGWKAYINGKETEILRANYCLRALKLPSGNNKITFEFKPKAYTMGENISLICSMMLLLALIAYAFLSFKKPELLNE